MKNKGRLYSRFLASIVFVLIFFIFVSSTALAASTQRIDDQLILTEIQITTNGSDQYSPVIYEDRIVWQDVRNGNWDIYMYNFSTSKEIQITTNKSGQFYPVIYEDRIVWWDNRNGKPDIYMYNLSTQQETQITATRSASNPKIYGDRIVWTDRRNGNADIYMYNISTSKETQITTNTSNQTYPAIYDDWIVWTDDRNGGDGDFYGQFTGNWDIYVYNLSTCTETQITTNKSFQGFATIYQDNIVWQDDRNVDFYAYKNHDIYMYNLSTSIETQITTNKSYQLNPSIYDDRIVWEDYRNGSADIYMYNLSTSTETQVTTNRRWQERPVIYGDRIVWMDYRSSSWDIYMCSISVCEPKPKPPVSDFTVNRTLGQYPLVIQFTDLSKYANGWYWNFGDGTTSTEQNPVHTYSAAGTYTIDLTATNENGTDSKLTTIAILQPSVYAYIITNYGRESGVSIIDTATNNVTAKVPVGSNLFGVAVTPDGTKVYVTHRGDIYTLEDDTVSAIDTATKKVTDTVKIGNYPFGVAVTPDGKNVYVAHKGNDTVSVIDTANNTVTATVPVGSGPFGVAVTPDGKKAYVTNFGNVGARSNNVSVIDTATNKVTATIPVGREPIGVAITPDGTKVYVANSYSYNVSVIDSASNTVTATVSVGGDPYGVAVSHDGKKVYVANQGSKTVSVIDTATNTVTTTVPVGDYLQGVAVTPDGSKVYVTSYQSGTVSVIDTATNTVIAKVNVGYNPTAFGQFISPFPVQTILILPFTLPFTNFNANPTSGYAPLVVQFTDVSQNSISRVWSFGDGATSTEQNPMHTYSAAGTYTVNLTAGNANGTSSKTAQITVLEISSSSGGSSHSSSGGSGGGGGSPEPAKNVEIKELSQVFITNGKAVQFDFTKNATCVVYVGFDSKKTAGKTTTIVEQLKNKSTLTPDAPEGEVYNYLNIWVGNGGYATEKNIENAIVCFKVKKSWMQDKSIDKPSITLNRYSDKKWNELPTTLLREDDKYLYFTAQTPGFSPFAITGKTTAQETGTEIKPESDTKDIENNGSSTIDVEQEPETERSTSMPGFEIVYGIIGLLGVFLYRRK